jgi:hypothetical protein
MGLAYLAIGLVDVRHGPNFTLSKYLSFTSCTDAETMEAFFADASALASGGLLREEFRSGEKCTSKFLPSFLMMDNKKSKLQNPSE